jgi:hypothetical protein
MLVIHVIEGRIYLGEMDRGSDLRLITLEEAITLLRSFANERKS